MNLWSYHHYRISKSSCDDDSDSALRDVDSCELLQGGKQNNCCLRTKEIIVCCILTRWLSTPCTSNIHKGSFTQSMSHEKFYASHITSSSFLLKWAEVFDRMTFAWWPISLTTFATLLSMRLSSTAAPPLEILSHTGIEGVVLAALRIRRGVGELVFEDELHSFEFE